MNSDSLLDSRNNLSLKKAIPSLNNVDDTTYKNVINLLRCYILFHGNENFNTRQLSNVITGGHPELILFGVNLKNNIKYVSIENDESLNDIDFDVKTSPKIVYACIEYKGKNIKIPLGINVQLTNDAAYVYSQGMFSQKSTVDINHSNHKQINHKPLNKLNNDIRIINEGHIITTGKIKSNDFDKDVTDDNDNNSGQTYSWIEKVKGRAMIAISDDIYGNDDYFNKMNKPIRHNGKITNMYDNSKIQWVGVQRIVNLEDVIVLQNIIFNMMRDPRLMSKISKEQRDKLQSAIDEAKKDSDFGKYFKSLINRVIPEFDLDIQFEDTKFNEFSQFKYNILNSERMSSLGYALIKAYFDSSVSEKIKTLIDKGFRDYISNYVVDLPLNSKSKTNINSHKIQFYYTTNRQKRIAEIMFGKDTATGAIRTQYQLFNVNEDGNNLIKKENNENWSEIGLNTFYN